MPDTPETPAEPTGDPPRTSSFGPIVPGQPVRITVPAPSYDVPRVGRVKVPDEHFKVRTSAPARQPHRGSADRVAAFILVAFCLVLIGHEFATKDDPVTCDGRIMAPGDICQITSNYRTENVGYDEMVRRHQSGLSSALLFGIPGIALGSGYLIYRNNQSKG